MIEDRYEFVDITPDPYDFLESTFRGVYEYVDITPKEEEPSLLRLSSQKRKPKFKISYHRGDIAEFRHDLLRISEETGCHAVLDSESLRKGLGLVYSFF